MGKGLTECITHSPEMISLPSINYPTALSIIHVQLFEKYQPFGVITCQHICHSPSTVSMHDGCVDLYIVVVELFHLNRNIARSLYRSNTDW